MGNKHPKARTNGSDVSTEKQPSSKLNQNNKKDSDEMPQDYVFEDEKTEVSKSIDQQLAPDNIIKKPRLIFIKVYTY